MSSSRRYSDLVIYRRLLSLARPYWAHIGAAFLLSLISTPMALLSPLPVKIAVDSVIGSRPLPGVLRGLVPEAWTRGPAGLMAIAACLLVTLTLVKQLQGLAIWLLQTSTGEKLTLGFRAQLFRHVQCLSFSYHDAKGTADSIYRIQRDASCAQDAVNGVTPLIVSVCTVMGMIYVTAMLDWQLAVVALSVSPLLFLLMQLSRKRLRGRWAELKQVEASALAVVQEALGSLRVVKAFGRENREQERFVQVSRTGMWKQRQLAMTQGSFNLLVGMTVAIGTAAVLVLGVFHVRAGILTLGDLLLVLAYIAKLYAPLETIGKRVTQMQSVLVSAERAFAVLDEEPAIVERADAQPLLRAKGAVAFRNVSFHYGADRPALRNISFEVGPGACVGIAGRTGAGKSTLMSLLMRNYDPVQGSILLDGVDLRDYRLVDLRNQFGIVLQEPVLFSTSIAENIAYARPGASEKEIVEAANAANAHEFITRLSEGYETKVGERGMQLSGGERQRISLARAFLKDAPILILDEPTSSVDTKTESAIMEAMERLMHGRTTFLIAHRLNTLSRCNVRLQLEAGRLVEDGSASPPLVGDLPDPGGLKVALHANEPNG